MSRPILDIGELPQVQLVDSAVFDWSSDLG